ncbi:hypothetical protein C6341_g24269 [Phytophthora cactorum]|nr:hypothetical protein C6341_g24269 [Phytophthora cactorum]
MFWNPAFSGRTSTARGVAPHAALPKARVVARLYGGYHQLRLIKGRQNVRHTRAAYSDTIKCSPSARSLTRRAVRYGEWVGAARISNDVLRLVAHYVACPPSPSSPFALTDKQ